MKPSFFLFFFCGAIFKFGFDSLSPHGHTGAASTLHATKCANQAAMAANLFTYSIRRYEHREVVPVDANSLGEN